MGLAMPLEILFQDKYYIAIHKPSGLLVHRTGLSQERRAALQQLRDQIKRRVYPVHRLDRSTSGVLLFGLTPQAVGALAGSFEDGRAQKNYLAVVRGYTAKTGIIDYPLRRGDVSQAAVSMYRRLATTELPFAVGNYCSARYSLVEVCPKTGRMHQIRRHFAHLRHPIIGDTAYGDGKHNRFFREYFRMKRLLLAATRLSFLHPYKDMEVLIESPIALELKALFAQMHWGQGGDRSWF